MNILGVDPGLNGGLVVISENGLEILHRSVMPVVAVKKGSLVDFRTLFFDRIMEWKPDIVVIEAVTTNPIMGHSAAFKFGRAFQCVIDAVEAWQCSYELVRPRTWQKAILSSPFKGSDTKAAALDFARHRWPAEDWRANDRCKKPHDGLVDAACIAEYGRRLFREEIT